MCVVRIDSQIVITTPAKLNLFLEVLAKRSDGFHEIETLMAPVTLYDTLYFRDEPRGPITLQCEFAVDHQQPTGGDESFPVGADNLVSRALELIRRESSCDRGATVRLVKRIPVAGGLAGGSSDAAAALVAANVGWRLGYSREHLAELASQLGSDIPFFLYGGPAICRGRGERIESLRRFSPLHFVIVRPAVGLSTAAVYRACRPADQPLDAQGLGAAINTGDLSRIGRLLHNRLQPAAESLTPWIERMKREFEQFDVVGHQMSGSGTSYFGLCRNARHARHVAGRLRSRGQGQVFAVRSCHQEIASEERRDKTN